MKYSALILFCYLTALLVWPCADIVADTTQDNIEITQHEGHEHDAESDHCSPLCYCQCCQIHVNFTVEHPMQSIAFARQVPQSVYKHAEPESPSLSLFRPPQI